MSRVAIKAAARADVLRQVQYLLAQDCECCEYFMTSRTCIGLFFEVRFYWDPEEARAPFDLIKLPPRKHYLR